MTVPVNHDSIFVFRSIVMRKFILVNTICFVHENSFERKENDYVQREKSPSSCVSEKTEKTRKRNYRLSFVCEKKNFKKRNAHHLVLCARIEQPLFCGSVVKYSVR